MKLSQKKQNEIEVWEYFIPSNCNWAQKTDKDLEMFFEWSEQGKHKEFVNQYPKNTSYFVALTEGKRWSGIHMGMYEKGILDGTVPYFTLLDGYDKKIYRKWWQFWKPKYWFEHNPIPRPVVDFMKKELFKGMDSDIIESVYTKLLSTYISH